MPARSSGESFALDKPDDSNDLEAPQLIPRKEELVEAFVRKIGLGAQPKKQVLKVPVTINNIVKLFKRPKAGHSSTYSYIWERIVEEHGNERISPGWTCMRVGVIGRNLSFKQQKALASTNGVVLSELLPRILFNFLEHARSETNVYPDGQDPWTHARTSTSMLDSNGNAWLLGCGPGGPSGLGVSHRIFDGGNVGVAVALPEEVQGRVDAGMAYLLANL